MKLYLVFVNLNINVISVIYVCKVNLYGGRVGEWKESFVYSPKSKL